MEAAFKDAAAQPPSNKTAALTSLLDSVLTSQDGPGNNDSNNDVLAPDLKIFITALVQESVGLVVSKQVAAVFVKRLNDIKDAEARRSVAERTLELLQDRQASFEEQIVATREVLADLLEQDEEWTDAARMLQGIPLDTSARFITDEYKLKTYIRIVRLLIEDDDTVTAQSYLSRAQSLIHIAKDQETILAFKLSQARIYDSQRKFQEAASKYHEISYVPEIEEGERLQMLSAAVTCAILSPAGPRRSRLLASLHRDERSSQLPHYNILSAMFLDRIIRPNEVAQFSEMLQDHQKAKLGSNSLIFANDDDDEDHEEDYDLDAAIENGMKVEGSSSTNGIKEKMARKKGPEDVLDKAVMEHNLLSASLIYSNITFSGLGKLLNLNKSAAEAMARTMIIQGRLKGATIDQVESLITFERRDKDEQTETGSSNVAAAAAAAAAAASAAGVGEATSEESDKGIWHIAPETARWDARIRRQAQLVEALAAQCDTLLLAGATA